MNSKQAKEIRIENFLSGIGIEPENITPNTLKYKSPFRQKEKEASFHVDRKKNVWFDFGTGQGGTIIDLTIKLYHISISEALEVLSKESSSHFSFLPANSLNLKDKESAVIISNKELQNKYLIDYLEHDRKINTDKTKQYISEISYTTYGKNYNGIAFKNNSNGYEVRSKTAKLCIHSKDITTIVNGNSTIAVFEGFIDFLSYICLFAEQTTDYVILNSTAMLNKAIEYCKPYQSINLFLDNDTAGTNATNLFCSSLPNCFDKRLFYTEFKDLNEYLQENC